MTTIITSQLVSDNQRLSFLPKHFGPMMIRAEQAIYKALGTMCSSYDGGYWHFYELSNGGFYLAPDMDGLLPIFVEGNGYEGHVSANAAGIITTLCVLNQLCWMTESEKTINQYYLLRDYIEYHKEASDIYAAID
ncbi:antirestriction protein [Legionella jordanis]|uniref:antirestriction protein n=1 Tax=Legionella jordanis TaxID=456 RepID=UPI000EFD74B4|nr:antirestriction protein [Legionella jordanis]RMW99891.1 antirestriction protein [Legionella jordanis]